MKYYLDTEFSEGMHKPISWLPTIGGFNKPRWSIELISIGIKCEDGRTYYAISEEFNPDKCNDWVKENVLPKLPKKLLYEFEQDPEEFFPNYNVEIEKKNPLWKSLECIKDDVALFFNCSIGDRGKYVAPEGIEVYGYFADYDWVVFCSLFGAMVGLPDRFPMYCKDLKQMLDEEVSELTPHYFFHKYDELNYLSTNEKLKLIKLRDPRYPKQLNEHSALDDAEWNERLHIFINNLKK